MVGGYGATDNGYLALTNGTLIGPGPEPGRPRGFVSLIDPTTGAHLEARWGENYASLVVRNGSIYGSGYVSTPGDPKKFSPLIGKIDPITLARANAWYFAGATFYGMTADASGNS